MWDVTGQKFRKDMRGQISTHTSRVGCDAIEKSLYNNANISTHTSRVGCDGGFKMETRARKRFLLTHPVWDVTYRVEGKKIVKDISTHTSRVGCDMTFLIF